MRHDNRQVRKIHRHVVDRHRMAILQAEATSAGHAAPDAAVTGVKNYRQFRLCKDFVERISKRITRGKLLHGRMELQSAYRSFRKKALRLPQTMRSTVRIDARERNGDIRIRGCKPHD